VKKPLLAIVGPTAVGKSALALRIAQRFEGEIVSADSRQVYRYMDIGTATPSAEDRSLVAHHLIDVVDPDGPYGLAQFLSQARAAVRDIHADGKLPILVGGTGQYVWALLEGWQVPEVRPDLGLRGRLEERAGSGGAEALHRELAELDPDAARRIDARNVRRVVRALEVRLSGVDGSSGVPRKRPPPYKTLVLGLTLEREALYRRADDRVDGMIEAGWPDETRRLLGMGYGPELPSMSGLGYGELVEHVAGSLALDEAVQRTKYRTHRLVRQQYAWFRHQDERISWFDAAAGGDAPCAAVREWLRGP
jgi:tRNA dimethylallyltransferase